MIASRLIATLLETVISLRIGSTKGWKLEDIKTTKVRKEDKANASKSDEYYLACPNAFSILLYLRQYQCG